MTMATWATNEIKMSAGAAKRWGKNLNLSRTEMVDRYIEKYGLGQFVAPIGSQRAFIFDEYMEVIRHHAEAYKKEHGRYPEYLEWLGFVNPSVPLKIITPYSPQMRLF